MLTSYALFPVVHMNRKRQEAIKRLAEAEQVLNEIAAVNRAHNHSFFENKWNEQRTRQLDVMTETQNEKRERLKVMLGLEEELIQARDRLKAIQVKRRRARTQADNVQLMSLPDTVANIEEQIEAMATALGGAEFSDLAGATQNQTNALLTLSLAREYLYEAKVGLVEARLRRHRQSGARLQQYLAKHLGDKTKNVRVKYSTYLRKVEKYALDFPDAVQPALPELGDVMAMTMDDPFWSRGKVEPAVGVEADITRLGIENFLSRRSAGEELRRIGREARQMTAWSNMYWARVVALGRKVNEAVGVVRNRLKSLYNIVKRQACKLWKEWGRDLPQQIQETATYIEGQTDQDVTLKEEFGRVTAWADQEWKALAGKPIIQAEEPDDYEQAEDLHYENLYDMNGEML
ncbi:uncharacterized protein MELLADRAFT_94087 [Melampsora larici-populina 98AG31]|uniref:Uncharacterized protein n=1 Tax=Melampsora larici-populina (strain 98AG31 / pathotype 3-4-7) TaxID=747676 RepID=F4S6C6_MELLP|nr:uncharacterized protein MELLADRAFT_94087 [Melampsora larici-populina 98AG31]EGF99819.1 hypothetical protein MELLADRAFT_94087 [Melampsora larici-populina 98AG31]